MNSPLSDWTPDLPLRSDATNEQLEDRASHFWETRHERPRDGVSTDVMAAREFAQACVSASLGAQESGTFSWPHDGEVHVETAQYYCEMWLYSRGTDATHAHDEWVRDFAADFDLYLSGLAHKVAAPPVAEDSK